MSKISFSWLKPADLDLRNHPSQIETRILWTIVIWDNKQPYRNILRKCSKCPLKKKQQQKKLDLQS